MCNFIFHPRCQFKVTLYQDIFLSCFHLLKNRAGESVGYQDLFNNPWEFYGRDDELNWIKEALGFNNHAW